MALAFFGRDGIFSAFILLGIVGISAQGGRSANRNCSILLKVVGFVARSRKFTFIFNVLLYSCYIEMLCRMVQ